MSASNIRRNLQTIPDHKPLPFNRNYHSYSTLYIDLLSWGVVFQLSEYTFTIWWVCLCECMNVLIFQLVLTLTSMPSLSLFYSLAMRVECANVRKIHIRLALSHVTNFVTLLDCCHCTTLLLTISIWILYLSYCSGVVINVLLCSRN